MDERGWNMFCLKPYLLAWQTTIGGFLTTPELHPEEWGGVCATSGTPTLRATERRTPKASVFGGHHFCALSLLECWWAHTVPLLSSCLAKASGCAPDPAHSHCFAELSCYLTNAGGSMQCTQDASWSPGSVAGRAWIPGSHRSITIRETVLGRLPKQGHCTDSGGEHSPSESVKKACVLVLQPQPFP